MLYYVYASLFDSPAQTLVNTVNTVGVMGKGIAKSFKERYPKMFSEYKSLCDRHVLAPGKLHLWKDPSTWILNFPTKTTWRMPSKIEYVEAGLDTFVRNYEAMGIVSVAFPPLGCGNGNLDWNDVRPLMESYLKSISIPVYIHSVHVGDKFVPEHHHVSVPENFDEFWKDVRATIHENKGLFTTSENHPFEVRMLEHELRVIRGGQMRERIPHEEIENAWVYLRDGLLSVDKFPDATSRRYKSYFFPILTSLPYVRSARISHAGQDGTSKAQALFFAKDTDHYRDAAIPQYRQECLFP